jgi:hypothetical protein
VSISDTGAKVAPTGAVTVTDVADAAVTSALVAPKCTMLLLAVVLKLVPVIVTVVPVSPVFGLTDVILGGIGIGLFLKIERLFPT